MNKLSDQIKAGFQQIKQSGRMNADLEAWADQVEKMEQQIEANKTLAAKIATLQKIAVFQALPKAASQYIATLKKRLDYWESMEFIECEIYETTDCIRLKEKPCKLCLKYLEVYSDGIGPDGIKGMPTAFEVFPEAATEVEPTPTDSQEPSM